MIEKIIKVIEYLMIFTIFFLFYIIQPIRSNKILYIPNGSLNYTIKILQKSGYDINYFDKYLLFLIGKPQSGFIDMQKSKMTKIDFLYRLSHFKAPLKKVMIIPGESDYFIYKQIAHKMGFDEFKCNIPSGILFPDTYFLPYGFNKKQVCNYLYDKSLKRHKNIAKKVFGYWNFKNYYKYLIIASIIQKEAGNIDEMKLISSVIYNRLKKNMRLQMDGALNYGEFSHQKVTPKRIKEDNTKFNTYKFKGLPLEPVCVSSQQAILAAFFPAKTNYLYFVRVNSKHKFSATYKAHLKNMHKF